MELKEIMVRAFVEAVPQHKEGEAEFLTAVTEDDLRRAFFLCLIYRMPLAKLKELKGAGKTAEEINEERNRYIVQMASDMDPSIKRVNEELERMNTLIDENKRTTGYLKSEVAQAIERERNALQDQIQSLKEQLQREQAMSMDFRSEARKCQERLEELQNQKTAPAKKSLEKLPEKLPEKPQDNDSGNRKELEQRAHVLLMEREKSREADGLLERRRQKKQRAEYEMELDAFLMELIHTPDLSTEQKDFLVASLESGVAVRNVRRVMVPTLTVEQMAKFIRIYEKKNEEKRGNRK